MRIANVGTRVKLGDRSGKTDVAALDDICPIGDKAGKMKVLLGNHNAHAFALHGENGFDHLLDDLW
ncbi:MAG: hypothetical protein QOF63_3968 [Thermoanaerobaculia bacterium]|nr:hypothetical protein [Thermoanaerobaculia bacterium]